MSRQIIIRLEVPDDPLHQPTVQEVFLQLLDLVDLADQGGPAAWKLVSVTKKSPLTVVAEATPRTPGGTLDAAAVALQVESFQSGIREVSRGRLPTQWNGGKSRRLVKQILNRTARSIPRTEVAFDERGNHSRDEARSISIAPTTETSDLLVRLDNDAPSLGLGSVKAQMGEIVGRFVEVKTHYHRPAIIVRERLSGDDVLCVITEADRDKIAKTAGFDDVWRERRVAVTGKIEYDEQRRIAKVTATSVKLLDDQTVSDEVLRRPDLTGGLSPEEYLKRLREGTLG